MQTPTWTRLIAILGVLLACSCWITAPALFGTVMGESFGRDPAEMARIEASRKFWTAVLLALWIGGMVASGTIAGFTLRTNRVLAVLALTILSAFVVTAVVWGT